MGKIKIKNLDHNDAPSTTKKKKVKLGTADLVRQRRKDIHKPRVNPFDYKFSKKRYHIVGQANIKGSKGAPLASRAKAIRKREATILKEYKGLNRSGRHEDNRIKAITRTKRNIYNLDDDVEGFLDIKKPQTVFSAQKLTMDESDSDDDVEQAMSDAMMEKMNFGGGFLTKKVAEGPEKTKAEIYADVIADSKKRKFERQAEKDENQILAEKLMEKWKNGIEKATNSGQEKELKPEDPTIDDFARAMREVKQDDWLALPPEKPKEAIKTIKVDEKMDSDDKPAKSILTTSTQKQSSKKKKGVQFVAAKLEEDLTIKKRNKTTKSIASAKHLNEINRLKQKARKEKKSAIRELRRDNEFLAKVQLDEEMAADAERKRKVNKIMHDLATQEHEHRQMTKKVKP